jgi:probable F420-dependent oxidoreductase
MRFAVRLPTDRVHLGDEFVNQSAVQELAVAAEDAGFGACFVTDHPFPVQRWLDGGGHHALDPFVVLALAAAVTTRIRLQTHILVLPYRNPFLTAKSVLTLDVLSGGRVTLGVAAGYLKGEFAALGADFEHRNEVSDETIRAMQRAWTEDDVRFEGRHFHARGNTMHPRPAQRPHPPVWVGGNSKRAIRRAVELGQGWIPFPNTQAMAPFTRTAVLETDDDLLERITYARQLVTETGRASPLDICYSLDEPTGDDLDAPRYLERVSRLREHGVTWLAIGFPGETRIAQREQMDRFSREVLKRLEGSRPVSPGD